MGLMIPLLWIFFCVPGPVTAEDVLCTTTVELDVVFPRNDTYAPTPIFPVVFAVQNLLAAALSTSLYIEWAVIRTGEGRVSEGIVKLDRANSSSNPHFINLWTPRLSNTVSDSQYSLFGASYPSIAQKSSELG